MPASLNEVPEGAAPCGESRFCRWAKGCADCRPGTWREWAPLRMYGRHGYATALGGASYEFARNAVKELAGDLRQVADELEAAHAKGFRLYEIDDQGVVRLAKGRVPR